MRVVAEEGKGKNPLHSSVSFLVMQVDHGPYISSSYPWHLTLVPDIQSMPNKQLSLKDRSTYGF